jgi:hypothetical protein
LIPVSTRCGKSGKPRGDFSETDIARVFDRAPAKIGKSGAEHHGDVDVRFAQGNFLLNDAERFGNDPQNEPVGDLSA